VSGGALGIDGDAHRAALRIDIPQVAVLPCGPDSVYPPAHAELFDAMVRSQRASLVFAHPPGTAPARGMFASRNRLVVALADAVLVVQAQLRSGSMLTGRLALADGKPTAAILGSPGVATLVAEGAVALRWEASQPGEFETTLRRWLASPRDVAASAGAAWPPRLHWLRDALARSGSRGVTVDRLGDPIAAAVALVEAETLGLVVEAAPGRYAAT
jgi:DNA processing protein